MRKKYMIALMLVACLCVPLFGCAKPAEEAEATQAPTEAASKEKESAAAKTPETKTENRGIVTNLQASASTSDPFAHANVNDREWILNCFEPLFCYNGLTGEHEPRVGKSYEISEDGLRYTIKIFDNIYFQNGKHCTAEDIKRSYAYGQASAFNTKFSGIVDTVEVVDDYTVTIVLKEPSSPFLSNSDQIFILDVDEVEAQGDSFGKEPNKAGTGAYYIEKYDPAVEIVLKRHEKFHRPIKGEPIPSVTFRIMTDTAAALMAFEAGDLDFISNMPASNYALVEESGKFNAKVGQTTQLIYMSMNFNSHEKLRDKRVRQAIAYALDYDAMLEIGVEGYGNVNGKIAYAPYTIAAPEEDSGKKYTYQPEKAKELLKEAGLEEGFDLGKITCIVGTSQEKMAQVMQANLQDIGVSSEINAMEQVTTISDMFSGRYSTGIISYYMMMDYDYITGIIDIDGNQQSIIKLDGGPDFDYEKIYDLFREARTHTDEAKRQEIYTELEKEYMEAAIQIPILHTALPYAWHKDLEINTLKPYTYHYSQFWDAYWK